MDLTKKPKLRWPLDTQTIEYRGQLYVVLSDPLGVAPEPATIPHPLLPVLTRLDGNHSLEMILHEGGPYGLTKDILYSFLKQLDEFLLLESPRVELLWQRMQLTFKESTVRAAAHAGKVYPEQADELRKQLAEYIDKTAGSSDLAEQGNSIVACMAPHIDYHRGWQAYGWAYHALRHIPRPDVVFLIGTAHQPGNGAFHLTDKDFETPLGTVAAAREIIDMLAARYGKKRSFDGEMLHRTEHSLELQLPYLAYRYEEEGPPPIVPILVGSFQHLFSTGKFPLEDAEVGDFVGSLAEVLGSLKRDGRKVLFYAGVDLSHMGLFFGDTEKLSESALPEIERRDRQLLSAVLASDHQALFAHMAEDQDKRRVCGYPSLYTMLAAMEEAGFLLQGHSLGYQQAVDAQSDCIVTYASACWTAAQA